MISSNVSLKSILRSVITKCPNLVEYLHQNLRALPQTLNAPTETINESSSEATNSNVLEMISAEVNKNYIQTHFEDYNNSDDEDSESDEEQIGFDFLHSLILVQFKKKQFLQNVLNCLLTFFREDILEKRNFWQFPGTLS